MNILFFLQIIVLIIIVYSTIDICRSKANNVFMIPYLIIYVAFLFFIFAAPYCTRDSLASRSETIFSYIFYFTMLFAGTFGMFIMHFVEEPFRIDVYIQLPMCKKKGESVSWKNLIVKQYALLYLLVAGFLLWGDFILVKCHLADKAYLSGFYQNVLNWFYEGHFLVIEIVMIMLYLAFDEGIKIDIKMAFIAGILLWGQVAEKDILFSAALLKHGFFLIVCCNYFLFCLKLNRDKIRSAFAIFIVVALDLLAFYLLKGTITGEFVSVIKQNAEGFIALLFQFLGIECFVRFFAYRVNCEYRGKEMRLFILNKSELDEKKICGIENGMVQNRKVVGFYSFTWRDSDFLYPAKETELHNNKDKYFLDEDFFKYLHDYHNEFLLEAEGGKWYLIEEIFIMKDGKHINQGWKLKPFDSWYKMESSKGYQPPWKLFVASKREYRILKKSGSMLYAKYRKRIGRWNRSPISLKVDLW